MFVDGRLFIMAFIKIATLTMLQSSDIFKSIKPIVFINRATIKITLIIKGSHFHYCLKPGSEKYKVLAKLLNTKMMIGIWSGKYYSFSNLKCFFKHLLSLI